jgi:hypothetical protein
MQAVSNWFANQRRLVGSTSVVEIGLAAAAIVVLGAVFRWLTAPLGYPAPLDPVAGVALVLVLCRGGSGLVAVTLGVLVLQVGMWLSGSPQFAHPVVALGFAAAAIGQAWVGAMLIDRNVLQKLATGI